MPFNIGSQQASIVNNVDGDQYVYGGQHVGATTSDAVDALQTLRDELTRLALPREAQTAASAELSSIDREMAREEPDRTLVASRLERFVRILKGCGAVAAAASAITGPVGVIVSWLGSVGAGVVSALA